jgi:non-specific serine/threonine protein kinase
MGFTLSVMGATARGQGRYDEAVSYLQRGLELTRAISYPGGMTPIVDHLGDIARERGDYGAALDSYRETIRLWLELRDPHGAADSLAGFATVLAHFGDDEVAARLLGSVMAAYRYLGFPPSRFGPAFRSGVAEQLEVRLGKERYHEVFAAGEAEPLWAAMSAALDYQPGSKPAASLAGASPAPWFEPFGLTAREREILDLLIEGKSNAEIGDALFISPRTAGTHVSNIFAKLGVSSRAAAVGLVMRLRENG